MIKKILDDWGNEDIFLNSLIIMIILCIGLGEILNISKLKYVGYSSLIGLFSSLLGFYIWVARNKKSMEN